MLLCLHNNNMISARKVFVALLVGGSVAAPTALAFKPTSVAVRSKDAVAGVPPGAGLDFTKEEVTVRGGDGEDGEGFQLHKKDVIKVHGVSCLLFAAVMFLESLGGKYIRAVVPIIRSTAFCSNSRLPSPAHEPLQ